MDSENGPTAEITGKVMVVGIIVAFLVVVLVLSLHLYARWFWWRVEETTGRRREIRSARGRRFVFAVDQDPDSTALRKGLDPAVLRSLPVLVFNSEDFKDGLECAVCLSELEKGEKARLLPNCNHGFHVECIDMWFQTHATCPLCRNLVASDTQDLPTAEENLGSENSAVNVLLRENQSSIGASVEEGPSSEPNCPASSTSTSSRPDGMLIIDIPRHMTENLSSSSPLAQEELRSPMAMRVRSLKRLLSKEKRVSPCSSSCVGAEQVERKEPDEDPTKI